MKTGLGQTLCTEETQDTIKIIEVGLDIILAIEVAMDKIQEVIRGMEGVIIIIEEVIIEIKIMIEIDHLKDRKEIEETIEMQVIAD